MLESNAIGGNEDARPVVSKPAVNIDFFPWPLLKKREELNELLVLGRRPAASANVEQMHAVLLGTPSFCSNCALPLAAKVHDGGYADLSQLFDTSFVGLRAAIEKVVDLANVGHAAQLDFFCERWTGRTDWIGGVSGTHAAVEEKL